jgi:hypothetical protein
VTVIIVESPPPAAGLFDIRRDIATADIRAGDPAAPVVTSASTVVAAIVRAIPDGFLKLDIESNFTATAFRVASNGTRRVVFAAMRAQPKIDGRLLPERNWTCPILGGAKVLTHRICRMAQRRAGA